MRKFDADSRAYLEQIAIGRGLDIGCGEKIIGDHSTGVDSDPETCPDIIAEMDCLGFADNSQDYIVSSHCLEHHADTLSVLQEWYRVIRPGGKIGIAVPHGEYASYLSLGLSKDKHKQLFTERTLDKYLMSVGFIKIRIMIVERNYAWKKVPAIVVIAEKPLSKKKS